MSSLRLVATVRPRLTLAGVGRRVQACQATRGVHSSETHGGISKPTTYCRDYVKKHDYDSFLLSYFFPRAALDAYFSVKAFSVELATMQEQVSSPMIGKMRLQFWRDALKGISEGSPPNHPIALALAQAGLRDKISTYHLKRIVDARDREFESPNFLTVDALSSHAESTSSTVLYLLLSALNLSEFSTLSHAASHLGTAQSFATLLRALPYHAKHGRMVIPAEITANHGVNQEEVFRRGPAADGIEDAVFEFATVAHEHLETARDMVLKDDGVPKQAMSIFLAGVPVSNYLKRLEKAKFDAFDRNLQMRDGTLAWQIWWNSYKKRF